jgi:hypothetical protein
LPALLALSFGASAQTRLDVVGPKSVYAGEHLYLQLTPVTTASTWYVNSVRLSGSPVPFEVTCRVATCPVDAYGRFVANGLVILRLTAPATAAGSYTLTIGSIDAAGAAASTNVAINVLTPPSPVVAGPLAGAPPMPGLGKWETTMKTIGAKYCPTASTIYAFGIETDVWYYDGARVYFQMGQYTKDPAWDTCALRIAQQYRDYVLTNNGGLPGWRVFTQGLRMAWEKTRDDRYRQAVVLLAKNSAFANYAVAVEPATIRETAYIAHAYMDAELVGEPHNPRLDRAIDFLLGHFDQIFLSRTYSIHQVFYDGLAAEALIRYYELTRDPRIPPTIKTMLDWVWNSGWDKSRFELVINPDPAGPRCSWGCQQYSTDLINFVSPVFAWYWSVTGDPIYQQRGDELFAHSLDQDISYSGKAFSHNYRWSPAAVAWRSSTTDSGTGGCTYRVSPAPTSFPASGGSFSVSVTTLDSCAWTASTDGGWIKPATVNLTGTATMAFTVDANPTGTPRSTVLTVAGQSSAISQAPALCTPTVQPGPYWIPAGGGSITVNVTADSTCQWNAASSAWLTTSGPTTRTGSSPVVYTATANTTGATRAVFVTVAGVGVYVGQTSSGCSYTVTPGPLSIPQAGGSVTVNVTASASTCQWQAASAGFVTLSGSTSRTGSAALVYSATANTTGTTRAVFVPIANTSVYIGQPAQTSTTCTYTVTPGPLWIPPAGGSVTVNVTASASTCQWQAASAGFVTLSGSTSRTGSAALVYSATANATGTTRAAFVRIANTSVYIGQTAP